MYSKERTENGRARWRWSWKDRWRSNWKLRINFNMLIPLSSISNYKYIYFKQIDLMDTWQSAPCRSKPSPSPAPLSFLYTNETIHLLYLITNSQLMAYIRASPLSSLPYDFFTSAKRKKQTKSRRRGREFNVKANGCYPV
jgi:hypothetical protein